MNYKNYFEKLNDYNNKKEEKIIKKDCCNNKKIIIDIPNNIEICENCGFTKIYYEYVEENSITQSNPYYRLTSIIANSYRYKNIQRIHKWNNYDYKENTAINSYKKIREIGLKINLNNQIINNSIQEYKELYVNNGISTRYKIKLSLYIYCLFFNSFENNFFNIFEVLNEYNLTIDNFNKAINRSEKKKYFLQNNMIKYIDIIHKNYNIKFELKKIIITYNEFLNKNDKFNNNSLLILTLYNLLKEKKDIEKINFYKLFNISKSTIKKISKLI